MQIHRFVLACFLSFALLACKKEGPTLPQQPLPCGAEGIAGVVECAALPAEPTPVTVSRDTVVTDFNFANNWTCSEIEVDAAGATGDYRTFDPNSDVVWAGNLLQGKSLDKATPDAISVERAGGQFTINLVNGSNFTNQRVDQVNQSSVIQAVNQIIQDNNGVLPARFNYEERQVRSKQEIAFNLGVKVNTLTTNFSGSMAFSQDKEYNRFLVDFVQQYYTISYETPTSYEQVFAPSVTPADLLPFIQEDNPPVFIKSVTYGRRFYLLIESTESATEMAASIRASYDAAVAGGSLSANAKYVNELSDVKISVFAMGGDASLAAATFRGDFEALQTFLNSGGSINTGAPLSYKMQTLAPPHRTVGINVSTKFTVPDCQAAYPEGPPPFTHAWYGVFGSEGIGAACAMDPDQSNVLLFDRTGTRYAQFVNGENQGIFTLDDPIGRLGICPFDTVSAIQILSQTIYALVDGGKQYYTLTSGGTTWNGPYSLSLWGADNTHPFRNPSGGIAAGVGAACLYRDGAHPTRMRAVHFNSIGTRWAVYDPTNNGGRFGPLQNLEDWGGNTSNIPFTSIGAALHVHSNQSIYGSRQNETKNDTYQILFNKEGTKFTIYDDNIGFTPVYDLARQE